MSERYLGWYVIGSNNAVQIPVKVYRRHREGVGKMEIEEKRKKKEGTDRKEDRKVEEGKIRDRILYKK